MSAFRWITALLLFAVPAGVTQVDGLLHRLPKDGTWATYQPDGISKNAGELGTTATMTGALRIASAVVDKLGHSDSRLKISAECCPNCASGTGLVETVFSRH
jgi:hypothetical protein